MAMHKVPVYLKVADHEPYTHVRFDDRQVDYLRQGCVKVAYMGCLPPPKVSYDPMEPVDLSINTLTFYKEYWRSDLGRGTYKIVYYGDLDRLTSYAQMREDDTWYEFLR